jgi:cobyrinic acid a,c-diamide synthase
LPAALHRAGYGALPRDNGRGACPSVISVILQAAEIADLDARLDRLADHLAAAPVPPTLPPPVAFPAVAAPHGSSRCWPGRSVAIARDAAYRLHLPGQPRHPCSALGARSSAFFSPLGRRAAPRLTSAALWLPGGYPELHGVALAANARLWTDVRAHVVAGRPLLAECGGMMSLLDAVVDTAGVEHAFAGVLPGRALMQKRLAALGMQQLDLPQGSVSGHTFHYSSTETALAPWLRARRPDGGEGEAVYRLGPVIASYVHLWFPSNPAAIAALLGAGAAENPRRAQPT